MKTDELIVQLARSAGPVTPLPPPLVRVARWSALAVLIGGLAVLAIGPRPDLAEALARSSYALSLGALIVAVLCAAYAAFLLSVPGAERSPALRIVAVGSAIAWATIWLNLFSSSGVPAGRVFHLACALEIAGLAAVSGSVLFVMIRRAAPLQKGWTAFIACLAAVTLGAAATQIICPIDDAAHYLVAHVLTALVVGIAGFVAGRRSLAGIPRV